MSSWIDLHAHLNMLELTPVEAIKNAEDNGVNKIVTIGTCPSDNPVVLQIAKDHFPKVQCCLGAHPHDAKDFTEKEKAYLEEMYDTKYVVGVGEIGLDYYYEKSPRDVQQQVFKTMLQIAVEKDLPVQIHTRAADDDTIKILKQFDGKVKGIIHCFTGTQTLGSACLDLGLNLSFSGIVTFKNAEDLRQVLNNTPLDRLHLETDSPFLTPVPFRGKKNEPKNVIHVAELVAKIKQVSLEQLKQVTFENAIRVFKKLDFNY